MAMLDPKTFDTKEAAEQHFGKLHWEYQPAKRTTNLFGGSWFFDHGPRWLGSTPRPSLGITFAIVNEKGS